MSTVRKQQAIVEQRHLDPPTREYERCKTWYLREARGDGTQREDIRGPGGQSEQINGPAAGHPGYSTEKKSLALLARRSPFIQCS